MRVLASSVPGGGAQRGLAKSDAARCAERRCTYRTHDCGLPVELSLCQLGVRFVVAVPCARQNWSRRLSRRACGCDVPGHLLWDRQSTTREGHYGHSQSKVVEVDVAGLLQRFTETPSPPRSAGSHASKQAGTAAGRAGKTYRPRSVSSLLMRLRAMVRVCGVNGCGVV